VTKKITNRSILALLAVLCCLVVAVLLMQSSEDARLIETGDVVVQKVETFKKQNGRLPNSRAEMGLPDSETSQPFHEKRGEENYVVYFNIGFDNTKAYYFDSKKWEDLHR